MLRALSVVIVLSVLGCGEPINLNEQTSASEAPTPTIVPGMVLYFDASFVNGNYGIPSTPCGETVWVDLSGHGNHGTLSGFSCTTSGFMGAGSPLNPHRLTYDGSLGEIGTNLDVQPSAMPSTTWEGWIRPTLFNSTTRQAIFSSDDSGWDRTLLIEANTDKLAAFVGFTSPTVFLATSLDLNRWQHVAVVYTPTNVHVYHDNQKFSLNAVPGSMPTVNKLTLGTNPGFGEVFNGDIAYLTVYDRALSDAEIGERCRALQPRFNGAVCH